MQIFSNTGEPSAKKSLFIVLLIALILRGIWAFLVPVVPLSDSYAYDTFARNLAAGNGYAWAPGHLTAHWPVGTSFVYSLFYRVFGFTYIPIVLFNICISLGTIWLTMVLATRWFSKQIAVTAGLLLACWPAQIEFVSVLGSELLFNALLMTWLFIWDSMRSKTWKAGLVLGVVAAATCYVRPTALLIPVVLLAIDVVRDRTLLRPIGKAVLTLLMVCLLIAPWSIRNTRLYGSFVHIATNGGVNFWEGNNPTTNGGTQSAPAETSNMNEAERDRYLGSVATAYIKEYPVKFVVRTLSKAVRLYSHESIGVYWNKDGLESRFGSRAFIPLKLFSSFYWACALMLGLGGLISLVRQVGPVRALFQPAVAFWLYFTAVYAITVIQDRYHFAAVPFIAMFGGLAIVQLWSLRVQRTTTDDAIAVAKIRSESLATLMINDKEGAPESLGV
jgi:4-amino-4-deoxy-L-arabinose transferase-like glycosyltransferase